jgi:DNA-directed RNA polymerase specialized sigma24 family protein
MAESVPASHDINRIRKELEKVKKQLDDIGVDVKEVDRKVERSNATQLGALATALAANANLNVKEELLLHAAGMSPVDIAKAVDRSENAVRITLSRAGLTPRKPKAAPAAKNGRKRG